MIHHVHVENFKSLLDVDLALTRRNVLVGPNMSGKSNFISVFRFLNKLTLPLGGVGLLNAINAAGGFAEIPWRGGDSNLVSISLEGDFGGFEDSPEYDNWTYILRIVGDPQRAWVTVQDETLTFSGPKGQEILIRKDPGSGRRVLRSPSKGTVSEVHDFNRSALEYEIPDWEGNRVRQMFASFQFYKLVPPLMKQPNPTTAPVFLEEMGGNFSSWIMMLQTRYRDSFDKINRALKDALPDVVNLLSWPTQQTTVFIASSERFLKTAVPVWQMSDGQLCFLALLSLIYCPSELGAPLYCIEEPENYLHPRLLQTLVGLLDQVQKELGPRSAQVVTSTHSLELVDKVGLDDLIVFEKRTGATKCIRPGKKSHLRELLSREEMGLGDLYYSGALSGE